MNQHDSHNAELKKVKIRNGVEETSRIHKPAAILKIVFHSIIVHAVKGTTVLQQSFLNAVEMNTDYQAHLGFEICKMKHLKLDEIINTLLWCLK